MSTRSLFSVLCFSLLDEHRPATATAAAAMPHLSLTHNVAAAPPAADVDVAKALSKAVAEALGKPEQYVAVEVSRKVLLFGGSPKPAATALLSSIGKIDLEHNTLVSKAVAVALDGLAIPADRVYIRYLDVARENWGWNGKTFANQ